MVLPHLASALSLARWLTGNSTDAEDVVQDAAIRAFRALDAMRDEKPKAWLLAIVRNTAFTWLSKNRSKSLLVTDNEKIFEQAEGQMFSCPEKISIETALIAKADQELLRQQISTLPLAYREVLVLHHFEDMNYREIARLLSIPVGTVMSRLSRARALLFSRVIAVEKRSK